MFFSYLKKEEEEEEIRSFFLIHNRSTKRSVRWWLLLSGWWYLAVLWFSQKSQFLNPILLSLSLLRRVFLCFCFVYTILSVNYVSFHLSCTCPGLVPHRDGLDTVQERLLGNPTKSQCLLFLDWEEICKLKK